MISNAHDIDNDIIHDIDIDIETLGKTHRCEDPSPGKVSRQILRREGF